MLDDVIQYYYLVPIFSILTVLITLGINNWDITEIEKKLITRFKRLQIEFSLILFKTIVAGVCFAIVFNKVMLEPFNDIDDIYQKVFLIFITVFFVSFSITLILHYLLLFVKGLLVPQKKYYVNIDGSDEKWFLKRTTIKGQILLVNNNDCIFMKEWDSLKFKCSIEKHTKTGEWIFKTKKRTISTFIALVSSILVLIIIYFCFFNEVIDNNDLIGTILIIVIAAFLLLFFIILIDIFKKNESA